MLVAPIPSEFFGDLFFALRATTIPQLRQLARISFAIDDGGKNSHAGLSIDIGHGMVQTNVHLVHTLLDALYCLRSHGNGIRSFSCNRPDGIEFLRRPKTSVKQAAAVQPLKPLTVLNVAFASWHHSYFARINKPHLDSASLKNIPYGNPIDAGGLRCHRFYPTLSQPL